MPEVVEEGIGVQMPEIGVMIEVPAAVYQARLLAKRVDFLAVGSNDLTQYMLAVDRNNPRVASLYRDLHPAVLQALREVCHRGAQRRQVRSASAASSRARRRARCCCLAMGYDVLSMNSTNLPRVKWVIRNISMTQARRWLRQRAADEPGRRNRGVHARSADRGGARSRGPELRRHAGGLTEGVPC